MIYDSKLVSLTNRCTDFIARKLAILRRTNYYNRKAHRTIVYITFILALMCIYFSEHFFTPLRHYEVIWNNRYPSMNLVIIKEWILDKNYVWLLLLSTTVTYTFYHPYNLATYIGYVW